MRMNKKELKRVSRDCPFCDTDAVPDYKDVTMMSKFMSERGKIISRLRTGLCSKHQRKIELSIKRARYLAILPYIVRA